MRPKKIMRRATNNNTGAMMTSSARAVPSSPKRRSERALFTGTELLDWFDTGGRHAQAQPGNERLGLSTDRHLHRISRPCCGRDMRRRQRAWTGRGDELVRGSRSRRRSGPVGGGGAGALFGGRSGQVAGMGPQGKLDGEEDGQEKGWNADDKRSQPD